MHAWKIFFGQDRNVTDQKSIIKAWGKFRIEFKFFSFLSARKDIWLMKLTNQILYFNSLLQHTDESQDERNSYQWLQILVFSALKHIGYLTSLVTRTTSAIYLLVL